MADSTDSAFGFILFLLFLALLGYAAGGVSSSWPSAGTPARTYQSSSLPRLAGGPADSCVGMGTPIKDEMGYSATQTLDLKVYKNPADPGQKCATTTLIDGTAPPTAQPTAAPTATPSTAQTVKVTLAYTADSTQTVTATGNR